MPETLDVEKRHLHDLVDKLPPDQVLPAVRYLNYLCADPVLVSLLNAPEDEEPYSDKQRRADMEGHEAILRGEGIAHEELLREFGL